MSITHLITRKWASGSNSLSKTETLVGSGEVNVDQDIDAGATDLAVSYAVLVAQMKSLFMLSTRDMTIVPLDTNGDPLPQIDLTANVPLEWTVTSGQDNPYTDDVGSLEVTNLNEDSDAVLSIRTLIDATPTNLS
jgi:hypothetical protein